MLEKILAHKREEVAQKKASVSLKNLAKEIRTQHQVRDFASALKQAEGMAIIAEIKKASPSRGVIRNDFNPVNIALAYEQYGAAAISILTDQKFFQGDLSYLSLVRGVTQLPLLRKDFIIDAYQIYEARAAGADALLLIAAVLSKEELVDFSSIAAELDLLVLMEIHEESELERALLAPNTIIGINNRNLKTFQVDLKTTARLVPLIPKERLIVSESGIHRPDDLVWLKELGIQAVLIGEAFMSKDDLGLAFRELRGSNSDHS